MLWRGSVALPVVPCDTGPEPNYPAVNAVPNAEVWLDAAWQAPACLGWPEAKAGVLVAFAARFRHAGSADDLLRRFGAVSRLAAVRYWSTTEMRWNPLFVKAQALEGETPRNDFTMDELRQGKLLRFAQRDNRLPITTVQGISVRLAQADRLQVEIRNAEPVELLFITVADAGDLRTMHLLARESGDTWTYYSITRVSAAAGILGGRNEKSWINRAAALYRHIAGLPTDMEPPVAR